MLDKPNVYPEGGDPRDDLLTWYDRETDQLILRVIEPLREETTYAVVLTNRLVGETGEPVRSPWEWVHHLQQTEALRPLEEALPPLGLSLDDVAFAWTFTTARVTGDLVDVHDGLYGEGPLAGLADAYPAGVNESLPLHDIDADTEQLPVDVLIAELLDLGLFDGAAAEVLVTNYGAFSDVLVGGSFETPYLLADRDDGGRDDSEEWWQLDGTAGTWSAEPQRVPFTCVLPEAGTTSPPFPVAVHGHGYGSSRFEFLSFAWAFSRIGVAACAFDYPGHGPDISDDEETLLEAYLALSGLLPFWEHLKDSRFRDLDNDGHPDSGGDQWSADAFHTRDMVRQAVVDKIQFVRSLRACGTGEMQRPDGSTGVSCDWDGDGAPDIGGEGVPYYVVGGSLGGINTGVAAGVMPEVTAFASVVPGGGLIDTALRTEIGGAVEAMHGRLMSPLFVGYPTDAGGLQVVQIVNSVTSMVELPVATVASLPAGGRVEVENLVNGEVREAWIPEDGRFRVGIACDALDPAEKRAADRIPDEGPADDVVYEVEDNAGLGDELVVRLYDAEGALVAELDTWEDDVLHEGITMPAGSPLVAGSFGGGRIRGTPDLRRVAFAFGAILEPGDAIAYAPLYKDRPAAALGGQPANVLVVPTPGDMIVPISTGIALARAAGFLERDVEDPRYGVSVDRFLVDRYVVHGIEEHGPWTCADGSPCLFDADDLDEGLDGTGAPSDEPLRVTVQTARGVSGLRLPYVRATGTHGFGTPDPSAAFDIDTFAIMQIATYFQSGGQELSDDPCLEDASCAWIPQVQR